MESFTKPESMHGGALADELGAAGFPDVDFVDNGRGELVIDIDESDRAAVQSVIDAHVPPEPTPDPDAELDAGLAEVVARDDVPEWGLALIAQLRGQGGHAGRAAGRRPE